MFYSLNSLILGKEPPKRGMAEELPSEALSSHQAKTTHCSGIQIRRPLKASPGNVFSHAFQILYLLRRKQGMFMPTHSSEPLVQCSTMQHNPGSSVPSTTQESVLLKHFHLPSKLNYVFVIRSLKGLPFLRKPRHQLN